MFRQNLPAEFQESTTITGAADIYAAGWILFEVLCGMGPLTFAEATTDGDYAHSMLLLITLLYIASHTNLTGH